MGSPFWDQEGIGDYSGEYQVSAAADGSARRAASRPLRGTQKYTQSWTLSVINRRPSRSTVDNHCDVDLHAVAREILSGVLEKAPHGNTLIIHPPTRSVNGGILFHNRKFFVAA